MSIIREIKDSFNNGSVLIRLIYVNIAVFLTLRIIQLFMVLGGNPPAAIEPIIGLVAVPSDVMLLLTRFWTPMTYMFVQFDFIHLLFNILYLYWFGKLFIGLISSRLLLRVYILGGLSGVVMYLLGINLIPAFNSYNEMIGASGSVMAILLTVAVYRPNHTVLMLFFGEVKLKYIALVAIIIDLISIPALSNTGGQLAHLGGSVFGIGFGLLLASGQISVSAISISRSSWSRLFSINKKSKLNVTHKRALTDMEYNAIKVQRQKEVDRILEKIKNSGYESLSSIEKKTLFEASKDNNFK